MTVTDINFFLGRIPAEQFPFPIDVDAVTRRLEELHISVVQELQEMSLQQLAEGLRALANEQMADAVRTVSTAQGADPRQHTLVGFGGAAGQHICEIAESLGVEEIIDSPEAGLLSALGMGLAAHRLDAVVAVYSPLAECDWSQIQQLCSAQETQLQEQLQQQSSGKVQGQSQRWIELRYVGTEACLTIAWTSPVEIPQDFQRAHLRRFGYCRYDHALEIVAIRLNCQLAAAYSLPASQRVAVAATASQPDQAAALDGGYTQVQRSGLLPGTRLEGPAIVLNQGSTLVVERAWRAEVLSDGNLLLQYQTELAERYRDASASAPLGRAPQASDRRLTIHRLARHTISSWRAGGVCGGIGL